MGDCSLKAPHDCASVRQANDALRRHLDRACQDRDAERATREALDAKVVELRALVAKLSAERDDADRRAAEQWGRALRAERVLEEIDRG